jgi:hypothetical protein
MHACGLSFHCQLSDLLVRIPISSPPSRFARPKPLARVCFPARVLLQTKTHLFVSPSVLGGGEGDLLYLSPSTHQGRVSRNTTLCTCLATTGLVLERFQQSQKQHPIYPPGKNLSLPQWRLAFSGEVPELWTDASIVEWNPDLGVCPY